MDTANFVMLKFDQVTYFLPNPETWCYFGQTYTTEGYSSEGKRKGKRTFAHVRKTETEEAKWRILGNGKEPEYAI